MNTKTTPQHERASLRDAGLATISDGCGNDQEEASDQNDRQISLQHSKKVEVCGRFCDLYGFYFVN